MLRTFLIGTRTSELPAAFERVVRHVAMLYRARLITAVVRQPSEVRKVHAISAGALAEPGVATAPDIPGHQMVLIGEFVEAICEKGHEADVIAVWYECLLGPGGQVSADELSKLVRLAPRPIWLFREPVVCPEHILIAYDGSAHSGRALHVAAHLAETLGARLTVLNVDESRDVAAQDSILSRAAGYCEPYRITLERVGLFGRAAETIRDYVGTSGCHLLIVGAAGIGYLRGLLFGSVAGQLIANAPCSVLVAK